MEFKFKELSQSIQANLIRERISKLVAGDDFCCEMISSFNQQFPRLMIYPTATIRNFRLAESVDKGVTYLNEHRIEICDAVFIKQD